MKSKKYTSFLIASLMVAGLVVVLPVFAQTAPGAGRGMGRGGQGQGHAPSIVGTVSAINGNSITVAGRQGFGKNGSKETSAVTYTVDGTNAKVMKNNTTSSLSNIAVGDTLMVQGTVSGTSVTATNIRDGFGMNGAGRGVAGAVASVSGTTFTVTSKAGPNGGTATTYTVDASKATVTKNNTTSSVSNIVVGDTVMVQGTVSGTSVTATNIRDGVNQPVIQGNGQPVVAGSITAINGSTITITNKSNVTYTIDATSAKFVVGGVTSPTISNVVVGDNIVVQGTVNGNSVTASSVIDQKANSNGKSTNPGNDQNSSGNFLGGVVKGIGNFFKHMFGF